MANLKNGRKRYLVGLYQFSFDSVDESLNPVGSAGKRNISKMVH